MIDVLYNNNRKEFEIVNYKQCCINLSGLSTLRRPPIGLRDCVIGLILLRDCVKTILFLRDCVIDLRA